MKILPFYLSAMVLLLVVTCSFADGDKMPTCDVVAGYTPTGQSCKSDGSVICKGENTLCHCNTKAMCTCCKKN